ncbi:hypothetical protein EDF56_104535 [Novosphingobium sp. PhB165]|uniref:hypothetical protein n=1 Tax=Novosphingobium sp. PhB165 TaxID=2485105 RepID=UPI0010511F68|nr:hypothetical protein [Novosphingobium sp. PhB165]TCM19000.1 hypothetical protein EDF56_104535 [Novosphingobium sp. PhB165]
MKQFLTAFHVGLAALALVWPGQSPAQSLEQPLPAAAGAVDPDAMTGAYFLRDTLVPRADDLALIQRKPALYLSSFNDDMATVAYSLEGRRIVYRVVSGNLDAAARDAIDRALVKLQRKV